MRRPAPGLALIVVIGILGVLAVLAVAFVMMAQLERRASEQRVNAARAYLLARSGIEDALARLALGQDPAYGGENWDGSADGRLSSYEAEQEVYRRTGTATPADVEACPVRHAMRPSFYVAAPSESEGGLPPLPIPLQPPGGLLSGDSQAKPAVLAVEGRDRGYSGRLAGDYVSKGNTYALKAGAEGHGFHINGGDPAVRSNPMAVSDYNTNLRRMLGILAEAIDREDGADDGLPVNEADGWALIDHRPSTGWQDWGKVRTLALGGSQAKLAALKSYLALHAWTDKKVVAPHVAPSIQDPNGIWFNPVTDLYEPAKAYPSWGEVKLDPDRKETKQGLRAPDFERIPVKDGKLVGRAPIDLSWARGKRPALLALFGGLKGLYLDETYATPIHYGDALGWLKAAEVTLAWDPSDICHKVADRILTSTSELTTWQAWHDFCDALPDAVVMTPEDYAVFSASSSSATSTLSMNRMDHTSGTSVEGGVLRGMGLSPSVQALSLWHKGQAVRDLLKANFNPNGNLNKFSPNRSTWKTMDKGDLLVYSTEFSLLPVSLGHQEVSSVGRVLDRRGRLLASRVLKTLLAGPPPVRLTTQKEFISEDLGALDIAGDETAFRLPGQVGVPFITPSQGSGKTWGHTLQGLGGQGASLQTYPEPVVNDGAWPSVALSINPADYDGSIQLATVETAQDSGGFYGATGTTDLATPYRKMMMLARYTAGFDLDQSAAAPSLDPNLHITPRQNHPDFHQVTSNCAGEPGKLVLYPTATQSQYFYQSARQKDGGPPKLEELRYSLLRAGDPATGDCKLNTLYPDGCYAERDRVPEYLDKGNANGFHGVMSFWIKANHLPPMRNSRNISRGHPILRWANFSDPNAFGVDTGQYFFWGDIDFLYIPFPLTCFFEIGHSDADVDSEHQFSVGRHLIPHRWELLTLQWDFRAPDENDTMEMLLNAGRAGAAPSERGALDQYPISVVNNPAEASDITVDHLIEADVLKPKDKSKWIYGPHSLPLGGRGRPAWMSYGGDFGSGADATFDEFALYDFGGASLAWATDVAQRANAGVAIPASPETRASPEVLAAARFPEGRYYKESIYNGLGDSGNTAAEWYSAPLHVGDGPVRVRGLAWTQIVPPEFRGRAGGLLGTGIGANLLGEASSGAAISFELVSETGTAYASDMGGHPLAQRLTHPAFTPVNRVVNAPFRLHAVFQPNLAEPMNTPILDPLTLDDVTVYYEPMGGPRIVSYAVGED